MFDTKVEKTVYFVRHGESEGNRAPVLQSGTSPLSETGQEQARKIAERVSKLTFGALIASPFMRAKQTAEAIAAATGKQPEFSDLFTECIIPTSITDKPFADEAVQTGWKTWNETFYTPGTRFEDGENYDDLIVRADNALALLKDRTEESLVVVTHGFMLRTIVARVVMGEALTGDAFRKFQNLVTMENTGLTILRYQPAELLGEEPCWRLWIYNDHAHLAE